MSVHILTIKISAVIVKNRIAQLHFWFGTVSRLTLVETKTRSESLGEDLCQDLDIYSIQKIDLVIGLPQS